MNSIGAGLSLSALDEIAVLVAVDLAALDPLDDLPGEVDLDAKPPPVLLLADREHGPAAAEGVQNDLSRNGRYLNHPVEDLGGQGIGSPLLPLDCAGGFVRQIVEDGADPLQTQEFFADGGEQRLGHGDGLGGHAVHGIHRPEHD